MKFILPILVTLASIAFSANPAGAQSPLDLDSLVNEADQLEGVPRLQLLHLIVHQYQENNLRKAVKYARQAEKEARKLFSSNQSAVPREFRPLEATTYSLAGETYYQKSLWVDSRKAFDNALHAARKLGLESTEEMAKLYLDRIDSVVAPESGLEERLNQQLEETRGIGIWAKRLGEKIDRTVTPVKDVKIPKVSVKIDSGATQPDTTYSPPIPTMEPVELMPVDSAVVLELEEEAARLRREGNTEAADKKELELRALRAQMMATEAEQERQEAELEAQIANINQLKADRDREAEKREAVLERQRTFRQNLFIGLGLVAALIATLTWLYFNQRRSHKKLQTAYSDLESTQGKLQAAEGRIRTLLKQQVSGAVAATLLKDKGENNVDNRFVCIFFLDIRDFTPFAEKRSPEEIIRYQNDVFGFMIEAIHANHGIINQFMGDGFMATFGAPESVGNDCQNAVNAARQIVDLVNTKSGSGDIPSTRIGIGLHAGNVVTGNVGTEERMQYSVTGNPVIIAARIEQLNKEYRSQLLISREVYEQLDDTSDLPTEFKTVSVKGRKKPVDILTLA